MNFTYLLYCGCGFEQSLTEGERETILQCQSCRQIESKEKKMTYHLECQACGERAEVGSDSALGPIRCPHCRLEGAMGFAQAEGILFLLVSDYSGMDPCTRCRRIDWNALGDSVLMCPLCQDPLSQTMSNYWE